jgi:hypothetical protein
MHCIPCCRADARGVLRVGKRLCTGVWSAGRMGRTWLCPDQRLATGGASAKEACADEARNHSWPARRCVDRRKQEGSAEGPMGARAGRGSRRRDQAQAQTHHLQRLLGRRIRPAMTRPTTLADLFLGGLGHRVMPRSVARAALWHAARTGRPGRGPATRRRVRRCARVGSRGRHRWARRWERVDVLWLLGGARSAFRTHCQCRLSKSLAPIWL